MPENHPRTFKHEATLDELAGVGKNRRFDEIIDDEDNEEIHVICKRGDEEIPLAKPSRARLIASEDGLTIPSLIEEMLRWLVNKMGIKT